VKFASLAAILVLGATLAAGQGLTAHVMGTGSHPGGSYTSTASVWDGHAWIHPTESTTVHETEVRVGHLIYTLRGHYDRVKVGQDYPAIMQTDKKGNVKTVTLEVGDKKCKYRVSGLREEDEK
jgi:hypothetical protein